MKFKVWDSKDKRFLDKEDGRFVIDQEGILCTSTRLGVYPAIERYSAVNSTGKYDETATELFDRDIVISAVGVVRQVYIEKGDVYVRNGDDSDFLAYRNLYKKIGNKFENPELLET